jgi:transposase-like protein
MSRTSNGRQTTLAPETIQQIAALRPVLTTCEVARRLGVSRMQAYWWGLDEQRREALRERTRNWRP